MQTMYWVSRAIALAVLITLGNGVAAQTIGVWKTAERPLVKLQMDDGAVFKIRARLDADKVLFESVRHAVGSREFIAVLQLVASSPYRPGGFCGAGHETWLYVYEVQETILHERTSVLISSCLETFGLLSQRTGQRGQATDFSSIGWNEEGFSIRWDNNYDAVGVPIEMSRYQFDGQRFERHDVLADTAQSQ